MCLGGSVWLSWGLKPGLSLREKEPGILFSSATTISYISDFFHILRASGTNVWYARQWTELATVTEFIYIPEQSWPDHTLFI